MAGDKRDGDDLFEDLDKFFAPIREVDWDEPEEAPSTPPSEEHVSVHEADEPPATTPPAAAGPDEDFDETSPIGSDARDEDEDEVLLVDEEAGISEEPRSVVVTGQEDLFDQGADTEEEDEDWPVDDEPAEPTMTFEAAEADVVVDEGAEAEEFETPTDEELEAAAEHFAGSVRDEATYETAPIDVFEGSEQEPERSDEEGTDLLSDLGAPEVEEDILADLEEEPQAARTVVVGAEGVTGPSWQEPAAVEVGADVERRGPEPGERDVPAAFMTGLVLAGVAFGALLLGDAAFAIVAGVAVLVAQGEFFGVLVRHHAQPATAVGLVAGALMMAGAYYRGEAATSAMFALGAIAAFAWYMTVAPAHRKDVTRNLGLTILNMAWIPLLGGYLIATLKLDEGEKLVAAVVALTFVFDTFAFLVGSVWGGSFVQRPLAPHLSPRKSLEGLVGATLITVVVAVVLLPSFIDRFQDARLDALILALIISVAATLGDLAESLVKRDLGIKDMGSVLPGHGGILDRIDSLLFVAPAVFMFLR